MYTVVITGPIGAGKSTQCRMLKTSNVGQAHGVHFSLVPEFIDDPDEKREREARDKLDAWSSGKTSFLEFQSYIAKCQDRLLASTPGEGGARILERLPSDAVIFAEASKQPAEVLNRVRHMTWEVEMNHGLAPPHRKNWGESVIDADQGAEEIHRQIKEIVNRDLSLSFLNGRVIRLSFKGQAVKTCVLRVLERNRSGELDYTLGYLKDVCERYERQEWN